MGNNSGPIAGLNTTLNTITSDVSTVQPLLTALFQIQALQQASTDIKNALTSAASVASAIANALNSLPSSTNPTGVMTALQNALANVQALAPAGTGVVLNSASSLFSTIQAQLTALGPSTPISTAATELTELSTNLTTLAGMFP